MPISKGSVCLKGLNQLHTAYSPRRILHPLKLAGERGSNKWEAISWDEAVTLAATQITTIIDKYGPYSFFASVGGGGAYSFIQAITLPAAFGSPTVFEPAARNATCRATPWPSTCTAATISPSPTTAPSRCGTSGSTRQAPSSCGLLSRAQARRPNPAVGWRICRPRRQDGRHRPELLARRRQGRRLAADPSADGRALVLAWFRYIFENKLYDEEFTKYWTNLPFLVDPETKLPVEATAIWPDYKATTRLTRRSTSATTTRPRRPSRLRTDFPRSPQSTRRSSPQSRSRARSTRRPARATRKRPSPTRSRRPRRSAGSRPTRSKRPSRSTPTPMSPASPTAWRSTRHRSPRRCRSAAWAST